MFNSKYHIEFSNTELKTGYDFMLNEILNTNSHDQLLLLFQLAWNDFLCGKFSYDGATFVKERNIKTLFELPAFIHDWRNYNGYVGKNIDYEMFSVMILLRYPPKYFVVRARWTFFTWINILRHKYILRDLKTNLPTNLIIVK